MEDFDDWEVRWLSTKRAALAAYRIYAKQRSDFVKKENRAKSMPDVQCQYLGAFAFVGLRVRYGTPPKESDMRAWLEARPSLDVALLEAELDGARCDGELSARLSTKDGLLVAWTKQNSLFLYYSWVEGHADDFVDDHHEYKWIHCPQAPLKLLGDGSSSSATDYQEEKLSLTDGEVTEWNSGSFTENKALFKLEGLKTDGVHGPTRAELSRWLAAEPDESGPGTTFKLIASRSYTSEADRPRELRISRNTVGELEVFERLEDCWDPKAQSEERADTGHGSTETPAQLGIRPPSLAHGKAMEKPNPTSLAELIVTITVGGTVGDWKSMVSGIAVWVEPTIEASFAEWCAFCLNAPNVDLGGTDEVYIDAGSNDIDESFTENILVQSIGDRAFSVSCEVLEGYECQFGQLDVEFDGAPVGIGLGRVERQDGAAWWPTLKPTTIELELEVDVDTCETVSVPLELASDVWCAVLMGKEVSARGSGVYEEKAFSVICCFNDNALSLEGIPLVIATVEWADGLGKHSQLFQGSIRGGVYEEVVNVPVCSDAKWRLLVHAQAETADAELQFDVAQSYHSGHYGYPRDQDLATTFYRMAAQQGHVKAALQCAERSTAAEALSWYRKLARQGNVRAEFELGKIYLAGEVVVQNTAKALNWYRKAVRQGHVPAQIELGKVATTRKDRALVTNPGAQVAVGRLYETSAPATALTWYRRAAEQGHVPAQVQLGRVATTRKDRALVRDLRAQVALAELYAGSNPEKATMWYHQADLQGYLLPAVEAAKRDAEAGMPTAMLFLGRAYKEGHGVILNRVAAYMWLELAATQSEDADTLHRAQTIRRFAGLEMTPGQIAEAQRLAREWDAAHPR